MTKCSQCQNEAMYRVGDYPLCLHCYHKLADIQQKASAERAAMMNYLSEEMWFAAGLSSTPPQLHVPQPITHHGPLKFNSIHVDNSVVGSINTGDAATIDVSLSNIRIGGNEALAKALTDFTNAVLVESEIGFEGRNEILEQLAFIATELTKPVTRTSIVKPVVEGIAKTIGAFAGLATLWEKVQSLIH
jgi:hypothetical protein